MKKVFRNTYKKKRENPIIMFWFKQGIILCAFCACVAHAEIICDSLGQAWRKDPNAKIEIGNVPVLTVNKDSASGMHGISKLLNTKKIAGRELKISMEVKKDIKPSGSNFKGGKASVSWQQKGKVYYDGIAFGEGKQDWKLYSGSFFIPSEAKNIRVTLGIQGATGIMNVRNFKLETADAMLPIGEKANMGFADPKPKDGKGGWTDEGPTNDAAKFKFRKKKFGGVPFYITDPSHNQGNSIISFKTKSFAGPDQVEFDYPVSNDKFKYIYLLHSSSHNVHPEKAVGYIDLIVEDKSVKTFKIISRRDVANWWNPERLANAVPVAIWKNNSCGNVGAYLSKFEISADLKPKRIRFRTGEAGNSWLLISSTLSANDYPFPKREMKLTIKAGKKWHPMGQSPGTRIIAGSALDLSWLNGTAPAGSKGRVIINVNGDFAYEKSPDIPVRFIGFNWMMMYAMPYLNSKKEIEEYAEQIKRAGYNIVRLHFISAFLIYKMKNEGEFNQKNLDTFDYFVYALKKRGIYLCWDVLSSRLGFKNREPGLALNNKRKIHFDQASRDNFSQGVKKFLNHVNPYTQMSYAQDPTLALAVIYNEQEFAFLRHKEYSSMVWPRWRKFLKERYSTIESLKKVWGKDAVGVTNFDSIKTEFGRMSKLEYITPKGKDIAKFLTDCETEFLTWAKKTLREAGYKGPLSNYNMDKALRYSIVRDGNDFISMNAYHAHPMKDIIDTGSSTSALARIVRDFASSKRYGKPMVATEHASGFWNRYRYEHGLIMGGYGCFQNFSGLISHSQSITLAKNEEIIRTFWTSTDPVARANEFLTALLFLRRDAKVASNLIRIIIEPEKIINFGSSGDAMNPQEISLALVTGLSTELKNPKAVLKSNEVFLPVYSGSPVITQAINGIGVRKVLDSDSLRFSMDKEIEKLKKEKQLPQSNRSKYYKKLYFETSTGEIILDAEKEFLSLNTPRSQGICAKAGTAVNLSDFKIINLSTRGALVAVSIDGNKSLKNAKRVVIVYITNAFNTGMLFSDNTFRKILDHGKTPILWETGKFKIRLKNIHASAMKCYPLKDTGERQEALPLKINGNELELTADTAALRTPAIYFELSIN